MILLLRRIAQVVTTLTFAQKAYRSHHSTDQLTVIMCSHVSDPQGKYHNSSLIIHSKYSKMSKESNTRNFKKQEERKASYRNYLP